MRLAVVVRARSYLRTLAPIIWAAQRRKWDVVIAAPPMAMKSPEDLLHGTELPDVLLLRSIPACDAVIGLNQGMTGVRVPDGARVLLVDPAFDAWLAPPPLQCAGPRQVYASAYHRATHGALYPAHAPHLGWAPDGSVTGWVNGDWAWREHETLARVIRGESYGGAMLKQAMGRPTLAVFFSLKLHVPGRARWGWDGMRAYRKAAEQARDVARAHGWTFVVKGRDKHGDPRWLKRLGEYVTDRDHPYESLRLLSRAAWCIHYAPSGVGREAVLLGVPQTALRVPTPHLDHLPGHAERMSMLAPVDGVISARLMTFEIDEVARKAWVSKYLGVQDGRCAERVLDAL